MFVVFSLAYYLLVLLYNPDFKLTTGIPWPRPQVKILAAWVETRSHLYFSVQKLAVVTEPAEPLATEADADPDEWVAFVAIGLENLHMD